MLHNLLAAQLVLSRDSQVAPTGQNCLPEEHDLMSGTRVSGKEHKAAHILV